MEDNNQIPEDQREKLVQTFSNALKQSLED